MTTRWLFIAIILFPTAAAMSFIVWVGVATGALLSPQGLAKAQARDPDLVVLPSGIPYWAPLKLARVAEEQPEVVFIGSSRCQEVRSAMMKPYRAYNACLSVWTLEQLRDFLQRILSVSHPRVVVMALDYFMFTDAWENGYRVERAGKFGNEAIPDLHGIYDVVRVFRDNPSLRQKIPSLLFQTQREPTDRDRLLTFDAIKNDAGFRFDGSFLFAQSTLSTGPEHAKNTVESVNQFPGGPGISERQFSILQQIAALARQEGVILAGIQLPFARGAVDYFDYEQSYHFYSGIWREFESPEFREKLASLGIAFFDRARDPVGKDARYFIDPAHLGEAGIAQVFLHLQEDPKFQAIFPDLDAAALNTKLAGALARGDLFHVYHNQF